MYFETTVEIDAGPERVWATLVDVARWPEWTASMRELTYLNGQPLAPRSRVRVRQPGLAALVWEVTELETGRSFAWRSSSPGVTTLATHVVRPTGPNRVTVTLAVHQSGPFAALIGLLIGAKARRYVRMEADGLKQRCEAE
jgi:uncharacterized protein YndB with AHSA1/START domain